MTPNRRHALWLMAGAPLLIAGGPAWAATSADKTVRIERLIREARPLGHVSARMDFISAKLLGTSYRGDTLIGGPKRPEQFVLRDDAFDCVTFCEVVLAAAMASDIDGFTTALRRIRYDHGQVAYDRRNHYWADWCQRNVENGVCRPVAIEPSVTIDKTVTWHREFGKHRVSIAAITSETLLRNTRQLAAGDIIGFASHRPGLDYFHTGLVAFGADGALLLRDASQSHRQVVEQRMTAFLAAYPVRYVTLLRAAENLPVVERR